MIADLPRRASLVWLGLVIATCASFWLGTDHPFADTSVRLASAVALVIGFVKVRYVGLDFMELRTAPLPLRLAFEGWVLAFGVATVTLFIV